MPFELGDVVLVPFPFTDQTASKKRPAVVVSGSEYNRLRPDLVLMPITSQLRPSPALGETWLTEWRASGLLKPSAVKPVMATLEQGLILRTLGRLDTTDAASLWKSIEDIFGRDTALNGEAT